MSKINILGDEATVTGLKLAGLKEAHATDKNNVEKKIEELGDSEILVVTHSLYSAAKEKLERMDDKMVVEIPDYTGGGEDIVNKLIKEVLGFEIDR